MSQNNGQNGFSTKVMDDLMFSTMLPQKKLGGKFSKEPDTNTDGDLSVVFLGEEEDHCEKCSFKSKNINEMEKHKNKWWEIKTKKQTRKILSASGQDYHHSTAPRGDEWTLLSLI